MSPADLAEQSARFAEDVQATLDGVLPGTRNIVSVQAEGDDSFVVRPEGEGANARRVPLHVDGEHLADLTLVLYQAIDRSGRYLKTVRSDFHVHSVLDRTPLVRLEYRSDIRTDPVCHWQVHAERGAFSHLLSLAHAHDARRVRRPHDLSTLHFPVGGERFRPGVEDVLEFLVVECGLDHKSGWRGVVERGRESWRRRQLGAAVRDVPGEAARVLEEIGWSVSPPTAIFDDNVAAFVRW